MKVTELATELALKTLLIELAQDGVRYAQLYREYVDNNSQRSATENYVRLSAVSDVLASILPGVCPAQVKKGFRDFAATDVFPYEHIGMEEVEKLLAAIDVAWEEGGSSQCT